MPVDFGIVITEEPVDVDATSVELEESNSSQFSEPNERSKYIALLNYHPYVSLFWQASS